MDTLKKYKTIIDSVLKNHNGFPSRDFPLLQNQIVIDLEKKHFIQLTYGWNGYNYLHYVTFHIELKDDGKVWIHQNRTDVNIEDELIAMGIPKDYLVFGMVEPPNTVLKDDDSLQAA